MSDEKIKGVGKLVSWNSNVLFERSWKEVVELNSLWIQKIIKMYVEFPSDEEFIWDGSGIGKWKRKIGLERLRKVGNRVMEEELGRYWTK